MMFDKLQAAHVSSDGVDIAWYEGGDRGGFPVLLVHGFASTAHVNWVHPGWFKTLGEAGYRVLAIDNRGHGESAKPYEPALYSPQKMAADCANLLGALSLGSAHVMGYSMGARISAYLAFARPDLVRSVVFGGLGSGMVDGVGDWDPIAKALLAPSVDDVEDERGRMFRLFADQTKSDRRALAACISNSRMLVAREDLAQLPMPALVAVGTRDEIGGSASGLAAMIPNAKAFDIVNRDHMLAVGDRTFKAAVLSFFKDVEGADVKETAHQRNGAKA